MILSRGIILFVLLASCESDVEVPRRTPVVRANDGAAASMIIIACPPNEARAMAVGDLIQQLTQNDEMVIANRGGNARLTINACPHALPPGAAPPAQRSR